MRESVLEVVRDIPRGGGYDWPTTDPSAGGCLKDIVHDGGLVLKAGPSKNSAPPATFCSGLTFEIWFRAWALQGKVPPVSLAEIKKLQRIWFITMSEYRRGPVESLTRFGLGVETTDDPKPGDFAQLWRRNGSGHTVVVLRHDARRNKLKYFSTQRSTNGPGEQTEYVNEFHSVRAITG